MEFLIFCAKCILATFTFCLCLQVIVEVVKDLRDK